jgi:hypothetical protein
MRQESLFSAMYVRVRIDTVLAGRYGDVEIKKNQRGP